MAQCADIMVNLWQGMTRPSRAARPIDCGASVVSVDFDIFGLVLHAVVVPLVDALLEILARS